MRLKKLVLNCLVGAIFLIILGVPALGQSTEITIFHFNDTHSRVEEGPYDGMGLAKLATFIQQERQTTENVLVFDAGDTFHGQTIATLVEGESIARIMNEIGLTAMTAGNHDFNYGQDRLLELDEETNYPILVANVLKDGEPILTPYVILDVDGIQIAVFGIATPETTYKTHPDNVRGLEFVDPVDAAAELVPMLQEQADIIIGVVHLGIDPDSFHTSTRLAQNVPGIDLLIDGHSHSALENGMIEGETLIVQAGEYDKNLGKVMLTYEDGELSLSASLITKDDAADVKANAAVNSIISQVKNEIEAVTSEIIGETAVILDGERGSVRTGETNLGNLITDAILYATDADVVITNGGGIRASIPAGEITVGDVITVLPFGNYIITKEIPGEDILAALEHGIDSYPSTKGAFPHIAGIEVVFDAGGEPGDRLVEVTIDGEELDPDEIYVLATNDFMAAGGDEYTMFTDAPVVGNFDGLDEILIDYIQEMGTVSPEIDGRMTAIE
jgi:2',3'-cyclic-nucleotide 2'-phosphodiesterase (5'-nucleotidase family)